MEDNAFIQYLEEIMQMSSNKFIPKSVDHDEVIKLLYGLFQQDFKDIYSLPYQASYENEADQAILNYIHHDQPWSGLSVGVLRVLLERQTQMTSLAVGLKTEGRSIISLPKNFPLAKRPKALILALLYRTELPLPIKNESNLELPPLAQVAPLKRQ